MKRWRNLHYKQILPGVFFLLLLNCACIGPTIGLGLKDYGEDCDPGHSFSQYETKMCDSVKGLHCNPVQKECKCIISGAYYQRGKCRAKLSKLCGTMDDLVVECVKNSFCNMTGGTGVCHCNDDYLKGRQKAAKAEKDSDLETSSSNVKRKRKPVVKYSERETLYKPRKKFQRELTLASSVTDVSSVEESISNVTPPAENILSDIAYSKDSFDQQFVLHITDEVTENGVSSCLNPVQIVPQTFVNGNPCACTETSKKIDQLLTSFESFKHATLRELGKVRAEVQSLCHSQAKSSTLAESEEDQPLLSKLPLSSPGEFESFVVWLGEDTNYKFMINYFGTKGGKSHGDFTRKILRHMFTTELAALYNFHGRKGKLKFSGTTAHEAVRSAVRKFNNHNNVTELAIDSAIMDFFRFAPSRIAKHPEQVNL